MPPSVFIPLAKRFGLIGALGNWALEKACAQLASWQAQGLQPARLTCEITAPAMMESSVEGRGTLDRIAAPGVRLSIDDLGTGHSSLTQLRVLRDLGCDVLLGFHVACPMPADEVPAGMSTRENARREGVDTSPDSWPGCMSQF